MAFPLKIHELRAPLFFLNICLRERSIQMKSVKKGGVITQDPKKHERLVTEYTVHRPTALKIFFSRVFPEPNLSINSLLDQNILK